MGKITLSKHNLEEIGLLINIWGSAVRQTHTFLSDREISDIKKDVEKALMAAQQLYCYYHESGNPEGFLGVEGDKIEMLFIDAKSRGKGIGKKLINFALENCHIKYVDVNEENLQGVGFYTHMGFMVINRSPFDEQGRAYPILHLQYKNPNSV